MRLNNIIPAALGIAMLASCNKQDKLQPLSFEVTTSQTIYHAGDTVYFHYSGNAENITFYSGEPGSRYQYRNRVSDTSGTPLLSFSTATTAASGGTLSLLVSANFDGAFDSADVYNAKWTDITSRATWAMTGTATPSGSISLKDFAQQRQQVYIAFKYAATAGITQSKWTITGLALNHVLSDSTYTIANLTVTLPSSFPAYTVSPGWVSANISNPAILWSPASTTSSSTSLVITGSANAVAAVATEDWIIAGPIDLNRTLPDAGRAVKNISQNMSQGSLPYYIYKHPGNYNAVFFASSASKADEDTITRAINIVAQ